jgi:hypothetical protein
MPVGDQDHGGVAVTVTGSLAGGLDQPLHLDAGEIFPGALNLGIYSVWGLLLRNSDTHDFGVLDTINLGKKSRFPRDQALP